MNEGKKTLIKGICIILLISFALSGCGQEKQNQSKNQQSEQTGQSSDKAPQQLTEIENSIEKVIKDLNGPSVGVKEEKKDNTGGSESSKQTSGSQGTQSQGTQSQGTQSQGTGSKGSGSQGTGSQGGGSSEQQSTGKGSQSKSQGGQQGQSEKQATPTSPWEKITPVVYDIHTKWNSFMPMAAKKGASKELLDNFSNALNNLTNTLTVKNETNTLLAASTAYGFVPEFYSLFKTEISPEVKKIRYYIRNTMLSSKAADWAQSDTDLNSLKASWSLFKNSITKDQQEISNMLDFSIYELDKVVKTKSQQLIDIKGKVALSNIEALEKSAEKGSKQGNQSGGQ